MVGMGAGLMAPVALGVGEEWRILEGDNPPPGWKVSWWWWWRWWWHWWCWWLLWDQAYRSIHLREAFIKMGGMDDDDIISPRLSRWQYALKEAIIKMMMLSFCPDRSSHKGNLWLVYAKAWISSPRPEHGRRSDQLKFQIKCKIWA